MWLNVFGRCVLAVCPSSTELAKYFNQAGQVVLVVQQLGARVEARPVPPALRVWPMYVML